ncbi:Pentatricopeptide repeat-containing protein 1, partial [Stegodyphus mimosarum]
MGALLRNRWLRVLEHRFIYPEDYRLSKYILLKVLSCNRTYQHCAETLSSENVNNEFNRPNTSYERKIPNESKSDTFGTLKRNIEKKKKNIKFQAEESLERSKSKINNMRFQVERTRVKRKVKFPTKDEGNIFGNLSEANPIWYPDVNDDPQEFNDQSDDSVMIKNISKRYRCPEVYMREMQRLVEEKKLKEALDLFVDMKRNFVQPLHHHFTFMIGACGKFGFTEMAFKLLRQMTDRGLKPTPATLTGLFNSCAQSPFPEYGLHKARLLKEKIEMKNWELNQITYHSMIKAFGKCGDIQTAFQIVDEMVKADIKIDAVTYNFLLMSCIANKEAGFTYAVEVWRKMKARKCVPNLFSYNLLLRTVRDCSIGPEEISCLLLQHWSSYSKRPYGFITKESVSKEPILHLVSGDSSINNDKAQHHQNQSTECQAECPHDQSINYKREQIHNQSTDYRTGLHKQSTEGKAEHFHDRSAEYITEATEETLDTATEETLDTA